MSWGENPVARGDFFAARADFLPLGAAAPDGLGHALREKKIAPGARNCAPRTPGCAARAAGKTPAHGEAKTGGKKSAERHGRKSPWKSRCASRGNRNAPQERKVSPCAAGSAPRRQECLPPGCAVARSIHHMRAVIHVTCGTSYQPLRFQRKLIVRKR